MAHVFGNRIRVNTTTTGTGTITLGAAVPGFQTFAAGGVANGDTVSYVIEGGGGNDWEVGVGTYASSGTTLARTTVLASSNSGSAINLSGTSDVRVTALAQDLVRKSTQTLGSGILQVDSNIMSVSSLRIYSGTLADDAAASYQLTLNTTGFVYFSASTQYVHGFYSFDTLGTYGLDTVVEQATGAAAIDVTTGALTGTTGTDARWTLSIHTDGKLYIENRYGFSFNYRLMIMGASST